MSPLLHSPHLATYENAPSIHPHHEAPLKGDIDHDTDRAYPSTAIHIDTAPSPAMPSLTAKEETPSAVPSNSPPQATKRGMNPETKIGIGMIPVALCLCAMWIFFLCWWRKQRAKQTGRRRGPPVPDKDHFSFNSSMDSDRRGSRVLNMAAFTTPVQEDAYRGAQVLDKTRPSKPAKAVDKLEIYPANKAITKFANSETMNQDSPIDAKSPFRLKRGDTVKRCSLGTEIANLWLSPPPSVWIRKQPDNFKRMSLPPLPLETSSTKSPQKCCCCTRCGAVTK